MSDQSADLRVPDPDATQSEIISKEGVEEDLGNFQKNLDYKEAANAAIIDITKRQEEEDLAALDFEGRIEYLKKVVVKSPLHREINYKTLKYCIDRRILPEVEEFIMACPEFESAVQSAYYLLLFLLKGGGLETIELDIDGNDILPEQKEGLTEDEIDDLVEQLAYETNEYGRELVERMSPKRRLLELLDITPAYYDTFIEVLEFLTDKHTMAQVDTLLRGRDVLRAGLEPGDVTLQPSVFVDKLEKAGGIYWEKGWLITEEAKEVLDVLKERRA